MKYYVYILECNDGTFYTGITNNLEKRLESHNLGRGAKYTRGRTPVIIRYSEMVNGRSEALVREAEIKRLSKIDKSKMFNKT